MLKEDLKNKNSDSDKQYNMLMGSKVHFYIWMLFHRYGRLIVKDSNEMEWIYVILSVSDVTFDDQFVHFKSWLIIPTLYVSIDKK